MKRRTKTTRKLKKRKQHKRKRSLRKQKGGNPFRGFDLKDIRRLGGSVDTPIQEDPYEPYEVVEKVV